MANDNKRLIAEARMFAEARGERRNTAIVSRLADALEAATARTDREPQPGDGPDYHAEHASWLNRNRAVVEAQALEQAARFLRERNWAWNHTDGAMEAARAVELLAIDKSRETR